MFTTILLILSPLTLVGLFTLCSSAWRRRGGSNWAVRVLWIVGAVAGVVLAPLLVGGLFFAYIFIPAYLDGTYHQHPDFTLSESFMGFLFAFPLWVLEWIAFTLVGALRLLNRVFASR